MNRNRRLADAERTAMAQQIYVLLYISAGLNMRPLPANVEEAKEAFAQARTLAQLAVNIVDYIDPDNVMTTMRFHPFLNAPATRDHDDSAAMGRHRNADGWRPRNRSRSAP